MSIPQNRILKFQQMIFTWWGENRRDLPWRHTHDPYKITVSEIMLGQTQVSRVLAKYREFIKRYPTIYSLANASTASVLRVWKGMGYNRRALYLHDIANVIVREYKGIFPEDEKLLTKLPGLGTYTARAILVFAYKKNVSCVDTNIRRIITHFFFNDRPQRDSVIQQAADQLVPAGRSWEWHQALMDFGAIELKKINPLKRRDVSNGTSQAKPFKETNRFYRGRIIDMLRERKYVETKIINYIYNQYNKQEYEIQSIINGLIKDGLVVRNKNILSLPK